MRAVPYKTILEKAAELWSGEVATGAAGDGPNVTDAALMIRRANKYAGEFWEKFWWPEWMHYEQRFFRAPWNATDTYAALDERYYRVEKAYYQAIAPSTNVPPTDSAGTVNFQYWAVCSGDYSGLSDYDPSAIYAAGAQINWPDTQTPFQCRVDGTTGVDPSDTAHWGPLQEFVRNIEFFQDWQSPQTGTIGEVREAWDRNPLIHQNARKMPKIITGQGVVIRGNLPWAWLEWREPAPQWLGAAFDATKIYAIADQMQWTDQEFYFATAATAAGETPASAPGKWTQIPFPYVLRDAVPQAAMADMLTIDGQSERRGQEMAEAGRLLRHEFDKLERQQGQTRPLAVVNSFNANAAF